MRISEDFKDGVDIQNCILKFFSSNLKDFLRHDPQNYVIQAFFRVWEKQGQTNAEPLYTHSRSENFGAEKGRKEDNRREICQQGWRFQIGGILFAWTS
ncbi:MAG: hypothetical protein D3925_01645 [Candidatus Electrothrix sp. AR5]|nr:hypothetical protein [Candidatus Electrothrix sp. AR5]